MVCLDCYNAGTNSVLVENHHRRQPKNPRKNLSVSESFSFSSNNALSTRLVVKSLGKSSSSTYNIPTMFNIPLIPLSLSLHAMDHGLQGNANLEFIHIE